MSPKHLLHVIIALVILSALSTAAHAANASYTVVVQTDTYSDADWKPVVETLKDKYEADIVTWSKDINEALDGLKKNFPRYACFVCTPEQASRELVRDIHRLTRKLDDDPYTDVIWAILTGYDSEAALRIARCTEPLTVRRVFTATIGASLDQYEEGVMVNELKAGTYWEKTQSGVEAKTCPTDTTELIVNTLNKTAPDVFITSGHASERDWMPGYAYPSGRFQCDEAGLYATDTKNKRYDINSPNPKIHLAIGNCLIAHIPDRNCMALALMRSAGVYQMLGYTIPTGNGFGGWGVKDYFSELQAGRFTLAEAHYANGLALIYELEKQNLNTDEAAGAYRGLPGDRDTVVLYGDPAWSARMPQRQLPWTQTLTEKDGRYTFTIETNQQGDWDNRPIVELLPHRIKNVKIVEGEDLKPVIADNFILIPIRDELLPMKGNRGEDIPLRGDFDKGQKFQITFTAQKID